MQAIDAPQRDDIDVPKELYNYPKAIQFLRSKARKSKGTAKTYGTVLTRFQRFLEHNYPSYTVDSIIGPLTSKKAAKKIDVYYLLDSLISFYDGKIKSLDLTVNGVKSYLQYWDVEIIPAKFKNKVTLPEVRKEDERPLDKSEVRMILLNADNVRLRAYLFILASGGMRAVECLMIRFRDVDSTATPVKIYLRAEFSKNKLPREVYITKEASEYYQKWLAEWPKIHGRQPELDDLVFAIETTVPENMYAWANDKFNQLLTRIGLDQVKTDGVAENYKRHEITIHSLRRFVETTIEDNTSLSYADYILGHKKSVYYTKKEPDRRQLYKEKCMKVLTFLDYDAIDAREKGIESQILEKNKQIGGIASEVKLLRELIMLQRSRIDELEAKERPRSTNEI
jgi:integrase